MLQSSTPTTKDGEYLFEGTLVYLWGQINSDSDSDIDHSDNNQASDEYQQSLLTNYTVIKKQN